MIGKITKFSDIPIFTRDGSYQVDVDIRHIPGWIKDMEDEMGLELNPGFQRGHVWTRDQQIAWLEFFLRGGKTGNICYFNCPSWQRDVPEDAYNEFVCVDGLQRLTAVCAFVNNEIPVFGSYYREYEDPRKLSNTLLKLNVNDLKTEQEVLQWYVDMNNGGTPHTKEEIKRVEQMIQELDEKSSMEEIER